MRTDIPEDWDDEPTFDESPAAVDFEVDPLLIQSSETDGSDPDTTELDTPGDAVPDPVLDNALVEFVDRVNARDFDGLGELLADEVESAFLGGFSRAAVLEGLEDLLFRHPDLAVTRGDLGPTPVAASWILDSDTGHYRLAGFFTLELADDTDGLVGRLDYVDEPPEEGLVVEVPEDSERQEWEDWSAHDEN